VLADESLELCAAVDDACCHVVKLGTRQRPTVKQPEWRRQ
jgi:hypothetical protein